MRYIFFVFAGFIILSSRSINKWTSRYAEKKMTDFQKKYFIGGNEFVMAASPQPLSTKAVKDMSRRTTKEKHGIT